MTISIFTVFCTQLQRCLNPFDTSGTAAGYHCRQTCCETMLIVGTLCVIGNWKVLISDLKIVFTIPNTSEVVFLRGELEKHDCQKCLLWPSPSQ